MKESAQGNCDLWEGQQPFQPDPNGVRDCTTTLRWLLIGAAEILVNGDVADLMHVQLQLEVFRSVPVGLLCVVLLQYADY